jgi:hypothetical protein
VREVDLRFFGRWRIVDANRDTPLAPSQLLVREATQRRVRHGEPVSREQLLNANEPQRLLGSEPCRQLLASLLERFPPV